jgi:hypothetical protein
MRVGGWITLLTVFLMRVMSSVMNQVQLVKDLVGSWLLSHLRRVCLDTFDECFEELIWEFLVSSSVQRQQRCCFCYELSSVPWRLGGVQ